MPFDSQPKDSGDLIRADDWNAAMEEIKRLETDKLTVTPEGRVGIGESDPDSTLHVRGGDDPVIKVQSRSRYVGRPRIALRQGNNRGADVYWDGRQDVDSFIIAKQPDEFDPEIATDVWLRIEWDHGFVGIGDVKPTYPLHMAGGAHCTGTDWKDDCSRSSKTGIETLGQKAAQDALAALNPVTYRYREGDGHQRVGFIAEEVPELVAQGDRKGLSPMDILAVVTRVVQDQQREIQDLRAQVSALAGTKAD